ncbi:MAG: hypothetical protein ABSD82_00045 [Solirubrobacteraceae bacterium]
MTVVDWPSASVAVTENEFEPGVVVLTALPLGTVPVQLLSVEPPPAVHE